MLAIKIWNYFRGYVIIRVEGLTLEKFLNLAINKDIYIWDIDRVEYTIIEAKVSIQGFKSLRDIVRRVGCRVYIVEKKGFPFLLEKLKKRKMLGLGFIIFMVLIFFLTSFIWNIEVQGNEKIKDEDIINFLEETGVSKGKYKSEVDTGKLRANILDRFQNLSFVNVEFKGTKLLIEVKEQDLPPKEIDKDTPCNIVAKKKGIVEKIVAKNGKAIVNKGEIVKEGQLLITGIIEDELLEDNIVVHSEGEVLARTRYSHKKEEFIEKTVKEETGNVYTMKKIKFGEKDIRLSKKEIPFKEYTEEIDEKPLIEKFGDDFPIKICIYKYREIEKRKVRENIEALKKSTQVLATQEINRKLPKKAEVISKDVKYLEEDNKLITEVIIEVIEDIGKKQIIHNKED
ncbi:sporulation protein YqfD [Anaerosalibacter massiliensis]|uniref:Sporulation protein YqfD n=1 Tax=Anaerosalibacter massiliensis TaxID=1347392 RepID=A0A9X2MKY3_9FIRM|nr:sporulation protein YqfD [Anaerosalibacter massiliensis]MCR2044950.1 sporulation protein YqfD [Anaerosalibacter massiliensis]